MKSIQVVISAALDLIKNVFSSRISMEQYFWAGVFEVMVITKSISLVYSLVIGNYFGVVLRISSKVFGIRSKKNCYGSIINTVIGILNTGIDVDWLITKFGVKKIDIFLQLSGLLVLLDIILMVYQKRS